MTATKYIFAFLILCGVLLRLPFISTGLPYFYQEDEAHHFNRTVNMVKTGDLNPHYFHKPSLPFYLRIPAVIVGFFGAVRGGEVRKIEEIKTEDRFGIAGYSFTASHPGVVKWARLQNFLFSVGTLFLVGWIVFLLTQKRGLSLLSTALAALTPALIEHSSVIGVDYPLTFFALASSSFSVRYLQNLKRKELVLCSLASGFAFGSKYNGAPILLLPIATVFLSVVEHKRLSLGRSAPDLIVSSLLALLLPIAAFCLTSPFLFVELPLFVNQVAYEIWHYGVSGHVGHSSEPGLEQVLFYSQWLLFEGAGILFLLAIVGLRVGSARGAKLSTEEAERFRFQFLAVSLFPLLFFALMSLQKANFTRNMLPLLPYLAIFGGIALYCIRRTVWRIFTSVLVILSLLHGGLLSSKLSYAAWKKSDSRDKAFQWLQRNSSGRSTLLSGKLQLPRFVYFDHGIAKISTPGIDRGEVEESLAHYALNGYEQVVLGPERPLRPEEEKYVESRVIFPGTSTPERIVDNPEIRVYEFKRSEALQSTLKELARSGEALSPQAFRSEGAEKEGAEPFWLQRTWTEIPLPSDGVQGSLVCLFMTPWAGQSIRVGETEYAFTDEELGKWKEISFPLAQSGDNFLQVLYVRSPKAFGMSDDERRLGVAVKGCQYSGRGG